jgi:hypothetical protein
VAGRLLSARQDQGLAQITWRPRGHARRRSCKWAA